MSEQSVSSPKIISVINQKGGVGKTTTAVNLSAAFAAVEKSVLLIDLDPQGNATAGVGVSVLKHTVYEGLLHLCSFGQVVTKTFLPFLEVAGADETLAGAEIELVPLLKREQYLKKAIEPCQNKYEYIFIDCPPSLGLLTLNALVASDYVLIPVQCEFYALEGLTRLLRTVRQVQQKFHPGLSILGVLLTMYDSRCLLNRQVAQSVRQHVPHRVFPMEIPRNIKIAEASSFGQPAIVYDRRSAGALCYLELARHVLQEDSGN